jgi:hypothetical protein
MRQNANISAILSMAILTSVSPPASAATGGRPASPGAVFAKHDPQGRLPNTTIRRLGTIRIRNSVYRIYYLDFANPVSLHGQQRIAVIKNGSTFMGSYQCTLGREPGDGRVTLGSDRLTVTRDGVASTVRFNEQGPTRTDYFCGEWSGWDDGI